MTGGGGGGGGGWGKKKKQKKKNSKKQKKQKPKKTQPHKPHQTTHTNTKTKPNNHPPHNPHPPPQHPPPPTHPKKKKSGWGGGGGGGGGVGGGGGGGGGVGGGGGELRKKDWPAEGASSGPAATSPRRQQIRPVISAITRPPPDAIAEATGPRRSAGVPPPTRVSLTGALALAFPRRHPPRKALSFAFLSRRGHPRGEGVWFSQRRAAAATIRPKSGARNCRDRRRRAHESHGARAPWSSPRGRRGGAWQAAPLPAAGRSDFAHYETSVGLAGGIPASAECEAINFAPAEQALPGGGGPRAPTQPVRHSGTIRESCVDGQSRSTRRRRSAGSLTNA